MNLTDFYNQTVITCLYNNLECNSSYFKIVNLRVDLTCLTFSTEIKVNNPGLFGSLKIEMYLEKELSYLDESSIGAGFIIHQRNYIPYYKELVGLSIGHFTRVAISEKNEIKLPLPYNECYNLNSIDDYDTELYRITFNKYKKYSQL